jgi:hypothetical protein
MHQGAGRHLAVARDLTFLPDDDEDEDPNDLIPSNLFNYATDLQ